jgi:hypothetical protein
MWTDWHSASMRLADRRSGDRCSPTDPPGATTHVEPTVVVCGHVRCGNDTNDSVPVTQAKIIVDDDMVPGMRVAVVVYDGVFDSGLASACCLTCADRWWPWLVMGTALG